MLKTSYFAGLLAVLLWGLTTATPALAQEAGLGQYEEQRLETKTFDASSWEALHKELDYSGKPAKPKKRETPETSTSPPSSDSSGSSDFDFPDISPLIKVVLAIMVLSLLAWLIYSFVVNSELRMDRPEFTEDDQSAVDLSQVHRLEEELDRRNVDPYLAKAEEQANYHLAVRLHFLALLKQLNEQDFIQWKKERTNRYYLNEMRDRPDYPDFRALTLTFERVWYGNYQPDAAEYEKIRTNFRAYRQQLQPLSAG
jgi:hypothetical protein